MKRAFVIGHPIAHSRSPLIHGHWLKTHGIAGSYEAIDVAPADLAAFLERVRSGEFVGGNVTIPHKEAVFASADERDPLAETIGAANTLVHRHQGIFAFNTDYLGFLGNLDQNAPGWDEGLDEAIVLGAGGAARAILVALRERARCRTIVVLNRTVDKAQDLALEIGGPIRAGALDEFARGRAGRQAGGQHHVDRHAWHPVRFHRSWPAAQGRHRDRHRLCTARDAAPRRRARGGTSHGGWARHAAASGGPWF